jgi:hypothetical protein
MREWMRDSREDDDADISLPLEPLRARLEIMQRGPVTGPWFPEAGEACRN